MKITHITTERLDLELIQPYTIAYETISAATNFVLRIETNTGLAGWGCAAPDPVVTHETPEDVEQAFREVIQPALSGVNPLHYVQVLHELKPHLNRHSSALAMVDMALFDLLARKADIPLYQLLGGYRHSIPTSITIGILPIAETMEFAARYIADGFFILKLKGGLSVEEDIEKIHLLRKKYPKVTLRFDGNQGYSLEEAVYFYKATKAAGVEIFEQPLSIDQEKLIAAVTGQVSIPVMADESLKSLQDVHRLVKHDSIDMVNIKLMKVGGIWEGMHINSVAKAANMEVMIGCIDECALGISAGLHFALSRPNIEFADLDGHIDFKDDPFAGLFALENGILTPADAPGLGRIPKRFY